MITTQMKVMFAVGFVIFVVYIYALLKAIKWGHDSQRKDLLNDPELRNYYSRHGMPDNIDYDGMGDYGRSPSNSYKKKSNARVLRDKT